MRTFTTTLAFFKREFQTTLASRLALLVPIAGAVAGLAASFSAQPGEMDVAGPLFILQVLLYGIPLAAILAATGSAHCESGESLLLASLPASSLSRAAGKWLALLCSFALAAVFIVSLPLLRGMGLGSAALLFGYAVGAAALFLALGLFVGFAVRDGIKAHLSALGLWLGLTLGANLVGFLLLNSAAAAPQVWAGLMMLSPLDALRIGALFSIESVPFDTANLPSLARWWLAHPTLWFALLSTTLTTATLLATSRAAKA